MYIHFQILGLYLFSLLRAVGILYVLCKMSVRYYTQYSQSQLLTVVFKCSTPRQSRIVTKLTKIDLYRQMIIRNLLIYRIGINSDKSDVPIRDVKTPKFFGPARSLFFRPGPARNTIFYFRPVWARLGQRKSFKLF